MISDDRLFCSLWFSSDERANFTALSIQCISSLLFLSRLDVLSPFWAFPLNSQLFWQNWGCLCVSEALCQPSAMLQITVDNCWSDVFLWAFKGLFDCKTCFFLAVPLIGATMMICWCVLLAALHVFIFPDGIAALRNSTATEEPEQSSSSIGE